jgi:hypothetical protein
MYLAAALAMGAAAVIRPTVQQRAQTWHYTARVTGIPVRDSANNLLSAPFLGGFDVPRPQLVDINGDGKPDLFVQERFNQLIYFERVGAGWEWRSDRFQDLPIGEWYRFVDLDKDGTMDLLTEMYSGYARAWKNDGSKTAPHFTALGDTIRDVDGQPIAVDRQNILNAVDIDCNGKLDLFIGRVQGVVDRFEQEGNSPDGSPRFRLLEEVWQGIEVIGPEATGGTLRIDTSSTHLGPGGSSRHGANTLMFADVDGRGVLDLFWGDFFEAGLLRFENMGTCAQPNLTGKPARFPYANPVITSGYNAATFADADGDGNVDMVMGVIGGAFGPYKTSIENLYFVQQAPKGTWTVRSKRLVSMIDVGTDAAPALADVTGDGLLDLIIGSKFATNDQNTGTLTWYENVGSAQEPAFRERGQLPIRGQYHYAPAVADLDGDGLQDLLTGAWSNQVRWWKNTGTRTAPSWTLADTVLVTITRGSNTTPTVGDIDGDGLLDLVVGEASGYLNVYRNVGSRSAPRFELVSDEFQGIRVGRRSAPLLVDLTGDRILDMLIGNDEGSLELWRGTGAMKFERDASFVLRAYSNAIPAAGPLRAGSIDLLIGTGAGGLRWFSR